MTDDGTTKRNQSYSFYRTTIVQSIEQQLFSWLNNKHTKKNQCCSIDWTTIVQSIWKKRNQGCSVDWTTIIQSIEQQYLNINRSINWTTIVKLIEQQAMKKKSMLFNDLGGSRDTHRTKRAYGSLKIKVIRMLSNQDQSIYLVVLIVTVWMVRQSELVWGRTSQSKFWSKFDCGLGLSVVQFDWPWGMKPSFGKWANLLDS